MLSHAAGRLHRPGKQAHPRNQCIVNRGHTTFVKAATAMQVEQASIPALLGVPVSQVVQSLQGLSPAAASSGISSNTHWEVCRQAASRTQHHLRSLAPSDLATLLHAFTRHDFHPGEDFLMDLDQAVVSHPQRFSPQATASMVSSMALLDMTWARYPHFVLSCLTQATSHSLSAWTYQQLSLTMRCLKCFGLSLDDQALQVLGCVMAQKLSDMPPAELAAVLNEELSRPAAPELQQAMGSCPADWDSN